MNKAQRKQPRSTKAAATKKVAKKVNKVAKRSLSTKKVAKKQQKQQQTQAQNFSSSAPQFTMMSKPVSVMKSAKKSLSVAKKTTTTSFAPLSVITPFKRNMSVLIGVKAKGLIPCDPRFNDDEVVSLFNPKTNMVEPVIVAVPDISFEWLFSSPCDLHTFDVLPVVKDCIDPKNPVFESMDA